MSVIDELAQIRGEMEGVVGQMRDLTARSEALLAALGGGQEQPPAPNPPAAPPRRRARRGRARPGNRETQVLQHITDSPGITTREIGERLGVDPTSLYRVVNRLADRGAIRKDGASLRRVED